MLPPVRPSRILAANSTRTALAMPKTMNETTVPIGDTIRTGTRPILSLQCPRIGPPINCAAKKDEMSYVIVVGDIPNSFFP